MVDCFPRSVLLARDALVAGADVRYAGAVLALPKMVTRLADADNLSDLLDKRDSKWDLVDPKKKDEWMITTVASLKANADEWAAISVGAPTLEMVQASETRR